MVGAELVERRPGPAVRDRAVEPPAAGLVASVRRNLVRAVLERRFDTRLPAIDDLARRLGVSRTTVRAALQELERDGLVSRRRSIGTLINQHVGPGVLFFERLLGVEDLLLLAGHTPARRSGWDLPFPDPLVRSLAGVPAADAIGVRRDHAVDGRVVVAEVDFLRCADVRRPSRSREDSVPATLHDLIARCSGPPIANSVIEVRPEVRVAGDGCALDVALGRAYLRVVERHFDTCGEPIAWTVIDADVETFPVQTFRTRP